MFHAQRREGKSVIDVRDDLDRATISALESAIVLAECTSLDRLVVSLEHCRFCDSSALSALVSSKRRLGRRLIVVVPQESHLRRIIDMAGLTASLELCPSLRLALAEPNAP